MIKEHLLLGRNFAAMLAKNSYMLRMMALRELRVRYVGSAFGIAWAVINPLVQLAIYGVIFGVFLKTVPDAKYGTDSYFLFLLCGLVPWQFFSQSVLQTSDAITQNSNLVKKAVGFPVEILPIVTILSNLIGHMISIGILLVAVMVFAQKLQITIPLIVPYLVLATFLCIGLGWIIAGINVFLKDTSQIVGLVMIGLFFFTPIVYSPSIVPESVLPFMKANPMYHVVEGYRMALLGGSALPLVEFLYLAANCLVTLSLGGILFRKLKPWFAEFI